MKGKNNMRVKKCSHLIKFFLKNVRLFPSKSDREAKGDEGEKKYEREEMFSPHKIFL